MSTQRNAGDPIPTTGEKFKDGYYGRADGFTLYNIM